MQHGTTHGERRGDRKVIFVMYTVFTKVVFGSAGHFQLKLLLSALVYAFLQYLLLHALYQG